MEKYQAPEMEIISFENEDIIIASDTAPKEIDFPEIGFDD